MCLFGVWLHPSCTYAFFQQLHLFTYKDFVNSKPLVLCGKSGCICGCTHGQCLFKGKEHCFLDCVVDTCIECDDLLSSQAVPADILQPLAQEQTQGRRVKT